MSVATRLRSAFAVYIALLAAVLVYHVRTTQRAVESGRALTEISSRLRVSSTAQLTRISQMSSDAEKFLITRDRGYLDIFHESVRSFGSGVRSLDSARLSNQERAALAPLAADWRDVEAQALRLADIERAPTEVGRAAIARLQSSLDAVRTDTRQLAVASQDAMTAEVAASEEAAQSAERISWLAGVTALVLSALLSALLVRSIVGPLGRLAEGTREVSAGRFEYRLETKGRDEFSQVARDFNSMTERLDELDRMKRDFVAKVSHDLKTPLSSMQETVSVMLDELAGPLSDKQRQLLELNLESGHRLSGMLGKLLDLSRIEAGLEPDFQMLDVSQLVRRSVDRAGGARGGRTVRISFVEPDGRLLLRADESGIAQVLDNLIENATKFSPPGGLVEVRASEWSSGNADVPPPRAELLHRRGLGGAAVLFQVSDEGAGIPDEEKERVFMRFYQTDTGRGVAGRGVGLGLTICQEIVQAHSGALWVEDNEPRGSVFCVLLPGAVRAPEVAHGFALASGDTD